MAKAQSRAQNALGESKGREVGLSTVLLLTLFIGCIMPHWGIWAVDLSAYYYAGHFYGLEQFDQVYAGPPEIIGPDIPPLWAEALAADGHEDEQTYPFIYLPWVAVIMAPISAHIDPMTAMKGLVVVNAALVVASVLLAWLIIGRGRMSLVNWSAISLVMLSLSSTSVMALHLGQIQILVFAATLLCFERLQSGHPHQAALALALAACLKITPAAFGIIFLWNRCWGGLATLMISCLGFAAVNIWLIGWPLHAEYFGLMAELNAQVFMANIGVSMEGVLYQLTAYWQNVGLIFDANEVSVAKPVWQDILVKLGFVIGLVTCWWVTRRLAFRDRIAFQGMILAVLVPLMAPLGWVHYYLLASYFLPVFLVAKNRVGVAIFVVFMLSFNVLSFLLQSGTALPFMPQMVSGVATLLIILVWAHVLAAKAGRSSADTSLSAPSART